MDFCFPLFLLLTSLSATLAQELEVARANIVVDGTTAVAEIDKNFICATIDWWPHDKCNYNQCPWAYTSATNLNLSHPLLSKAIKAFKPLRIRVGGSLQDRVLYGVESLKAPCHPFQKKKDGLFGFSQGCLHMTRWDELNHFFITTGALVTFGLNALHGRYKIKQDVWRGEWDSRNAYDFIKYTISKKYHIDSWEFGNELSGDGVGARVGVEQYGKDLIKLKRIIDELYNKSLLKPLLLAPGGFYDQKWFAKLLDVTGPNVVDIVSHHIYNLGAGDDPRLVKRIVDPNYLNKISATFVDLQKTMKKHGPWASAWVGESGGAYNSGGCNVSDTFLDSFWYLDQLGMAAKHNSKVYCRQSLIGGNYGLLDRTTFSPNPDYFSALLWHQLMGEVVLAVEQASLYLRTYAHCSKQTGYKVRDIFLTNQRLRTNLQLIQWVGDFKHSLPDSKYHSALAGITLLLINLSNQTKFVLNVENNMNIHLRTPRHMLHKQSSFLLRVKKTVAWIGRKALDETMDREEYNLTPKDGNFRSKTMLLNGTPLELTKVGDIPKFQPVPVDATSPISITPMSMKFVVIPNFDAPACS